MISYEKIDGYNNKKEGVKCMICNHYYFKDITPVDVIKNQKSKIYPKD